MLEHIVTLGHIAPVPEQMSVLIDVFDSERDRYWVRFNILLKLLRPLLNLRSDSELKFSTTTFD